MAATGLATLDCLQTKKRTDSQTSIFKIPTKKLNNQSSAFSEIAVLIGVNLPMAAMGITETVKQRN